MKTIYTILLVTLASFTLASGQSKTNINVYTEYLNRYAHQTSKEYILSLFKKYDIVVLCERNHPESTQYDLIYEIVSSAYFINNVGNIFTEVGSVSNRQNTLDFIKTRFENDSIRLLKQAEIYRNGFFPPIWNNTNFYHFIGNLNILNNKLSPDRQINLFTSGSKNPITEQRADITGMKKYISENYFKRDSLMAHYIIETYDSLLLKSNRRKALVIMNYRHAFAKSLSNDGTINTGEYLQQHYGKKFANVYINNLASTLSIPAYEKSKPHIFQCGEEIPIQSGKWDAAFRLAKKEDTGFNFVGSPFGKDSFDIWPYPTNNNYEKLFTGFVYYLPLEKHKLSFGVKNFFTGADLDQIVKEWNLFNKALGQKDEKKCTPELKAAIIQEFTNEHSNGYANIEGYQTIINQWIDK
jgi:hypothetical protein